MNPMLITGLILLIISVLWAAALAWKGFSNLQTKPAPRVNVQDLLPAGVRPPPGFGMFHEHEAIARQFQAKANRHLGLMKWMVLDGLVGFSGLICLIIGLVQKFLPATGA